MTGLHKLTLAETQKKFTAGEVTAHDIVQSYTLRINQVEPKVKAYVTQTVSSAMEQADALDARLKGWRRTMPLMGMPVAMSHLVGQLRRGRNPVAARLLAEAKSTGSPLRFEWHCRARDGRLFWADVSIRFVRLDGGDMVLAIVRDLRSQGTAVVFVSHHLDEVTAIADRVLTALAGR